MKKIVSILLAAAVLSAMMIPPASAAEPAYSDISGHWAQNAIEKWSGYGIIKGYTGKFRPNDAITRGETAVILDRLLKYQSAAPNRFTDLKTHFYTDAVLKANAYGVMLGYGGAVWPEASISRQDAFVMIARALRIQPVSGYTIQAPDAGDVSGYARDSLAAMERLGIINGRGDGKLHPRDNISRAELIQVLDNMFGGIYTAAGTYTADVSGYVIVNAPGITLKDMTVTGTLVIAPGVGEGDCTLDHVAVTGSVVILGGGTQSIKFLGDSSVSGSIYINKVDGEIRVFSEDGTELPVIIVDDGCDDVILEGAFASVTVLAEVTVTLPEGSSVGNLTVKAPAAIRGAGKVAHAAVGEGASGTTFEMIPESTEAPKGITVVIRGVTIVSDGTEIEEEDVGTPGGGGGGGGDGGGESTAITTTGATLYLSDGSSVHAGLTGTTATFDLTNEATFPNSLAVTDIQITTSAATTYYVDTYHIDTNTKVSVLTMLAMKGLSSPSVSLSNIRALGDSVSIHGTVTGGSALTVVFDVGSAGYYRISNSGAVVIATLKPIYFNTPIPAGFSGVDPVDLLVANLANQSETTAFTLSASKGGVHESRNYIGYTAINALTLGSLVADFNAVYVCDTLGDLTGITYTLSDGAHTVTLILQ